MVFTKTKTRISEYLSIFAAIFLIGLIISKPDLCSAGASAGLKICADIIIPSLFPFTVPVLFLLNSKTFMKRGRKFLYIFILSMLGGYPIGAKMLSDLNDKSPAYREQINESLPYFINAGPAFIVLAVGKGILKSVTLGYMLLAAHCISAVICAIIFIPGILKFKFKTDADINEISAADNFVFSVKNASGAVLSICSFVIIFSVINRYLLSFSESFSVLKPLIYVTEITTAVGNTGNIYLISFLLGFSGFSVIAQVISVAGSIKTPIIKIISVRVLHGALSAILMKLFLKIFNVTVTTISTGAVSKTPAVNDTALGLSLVITALLFIINVSSKKFSGNIAKDVL